MADNGGLVEVIARGICMSGSRMLLCHSKGAGNTYLPGGHMEFGESARTALCREIEEEMGLKVEAGVFLGAVEHTFVQNGERHCEVNLMFLVDLNGLHIPEIPLSREVGLDFRWVEVLDLEDSGLEPYPLRAMIPLWLAEGGGMERWVSTFEV